MSVLFFSILSYIRLSVWFKTVSHVLFCLSLFLFSIFLAFCLCISSLFRSICLSLFVLCFLLFCYSDLSLFLYFSFYLFFVFLFFDRLIFLYLSLSLFLFFLLFNPYIFLSFCIFLFLSFSPSIFISISSFLLKIDRNVWSSRPSPTSILKFCSKIFEYKKREKIKHGRNNSRYQLKSRSRPRPWFWSRPRFWSRPSLFWLLLFVKKEYKKGKK